MKYLLDTCVISELSKAKPNSQVVQWIKSQYEADFCLSVLTIGEIQKGITKLADSKKKLVLQKWLDQDLKTRFENRILEVSGIVAQKWGIIQGESERQGKKMSVIDSFIAVTGLVYDITVVTRNIDDMVQSGLPCLIHGIDIFVKKTNLLVKKKQLKSFILFPQS